MGQPTEGARKFEAAGVIIMGLVMIVGGLFLMSEGYEQNSKFRRWQAAPLIQETGQLQAIGGGNDVVIVGSIDLENPTSKGLAIYTYWEERRDPLEHGRQYWAHVSAKDYRPGSFQLSLGNQTVTIIFRNDSEFMEAVIEENGRRISSGQTAFTEANAA